MYAQAFGAILGLIACLYEYVYGNLVVIGNRFVPGMDYINFVCGYALYPLCIIVFFISLINLILNKKPNQLKNVALLNKILAHITVIIGILGCKFYFIIPALLILYQYYIPVLFEHDLKREEREANRQSAIVELLKNNIGKHTIVKLLNVSYEEVEILELEYCSKKR